MNEDWISAGEAANKLEWSYHKFLHHLKKDRKEVLTDGLAKKVGWGWLVSPEVVERFREPN